jgi:signal transduction histidine kinase
MMSESVSNSESIQIELMDKLRIFNNVYGDSRRIVQILYNFLSNAIKFSNQNGIIYINIKLVEEQDIESVVAKDALKNAINAKIIK